MEPRGGGKASHYFMAPSAPVNHAWERMSFSLRAPPRRRIQGCVARAPVGELETPGFLA